MSRECHYSVLGIARDASAEDVRRAYKQQALRWHPDKHMDAEQKETAEVRFKLVAEAYEVLKAPETRSSYDRYGFDGVPPPQQGFYGSFSRHPPSPMFHDPYFVFRREFGPAFDNFFHSQGMNMPHQHAAQDPLAAMVQQFFDTSPLWGAPQPPWGAPQDGQPMSPWGQDQMPPTLFGGFGPMLGGGMFGGMMPTDDMGQGGGFQGVSRSTRTTIRNGEKTTITTERDANGIETRTVEVNGQVVERTQTQR